MDEIKKTVNDGLTALIVEALIIKKREEMHPSLMSDNSDQRIKDAGKRVEILRKLREDFENEMTKSI